MKHKDVLLQVLRIFLCELVCIAVMLGIFALLHKLNTAVWLGALAGGLLAIGNFFFLSIAVSRAADKAKESEDAAVKAKFAVQRSAVIRMLVLLALYVLILKSGYFHVLASILPLVFVQVSIYVTEFFRKDGANVK